MINKNIFWIYLKNMKIIWLIIFLLLLTQLASTKMALVFTHEEKLATKISVINQDNGEASTEYLKELAKNPQFEIIQQQKSTLKKLFEDNTQGTLIINDNFSEDYLKGNQKIMDFYVTPGIQNTGTIRESLAVPLLKINAETNFKNKAEELNKNHVAENFSPEELFQVEFHQVGSELTQGSQKETLIPLNLAALFILVFLLFVTSFLPGMDQRKLAFYGPKNLLKQQLQVLSILLLSGFLLILGFIVLMPKLTSFSLPENSFLLLFSLLLYTLFIGLLLVNLNKRQLAIFLFVPWFILNMTIGGGLWGSMNLVSYLKWLLPVSLIITKQTTFLLALSSLTLIISLLLPFKKRSTSI